MESGNVFSMQKGTEWTYKNKHSILENWFMWQKIDGWFMVFNAFFQ